MINTQRVESNRKTRTLVYINEMNIAIGDQITPLKAYGPPMVQTKDKWDHNKQFQLYPARTLLYDIKLHYIRRAGVVNEL